MVNSQSYWKLVLLWGFKQNQPLNWDLVTLFCFKNYNSVCSVSSWDTVLVSCSVNP